MTGFTREIVIFQGSAAKHSHKALFCMPEECYCDCRGDVLAAVAARTGHADKIHICAGLADLVQVALWSRRPDRQELRELLETAGADSEMVSCAEKNGDLSALCRSDGLPVLRRLCRRAKAEAEKRTGAVVSCHLVSEQSEKIVASSL